MFGSSKLGAAAAVMLSAVGLSGGFAAPQREPQPYRPRKKKKNRAGRIAKSSYGNNLLAHYNNRGICWSSKKSKLRRTYGAHHAYAL